MGKCQKSADGTIVGSGGEIWQRRHQLSGVGDIISINASLSHM